MSKLPPSMPKTMNPDNPITGQDLYDIYREINDYAQGVYGLSAHPLIQPHSEFILRSDWQKKAEKLATLFKNLPQLLDDWINNVCLATTIDWRSENEVKFWHPDFGYMCGGDRRGWSWADIESKHGWHGFITVHIPQQPKPAVKPKEEEPPANPELVDAILNKFLRRKSNPEYPMATFPPHHGLNPEQLRLYGRWLKDYPLGTVAQFKAEIINPPPRPIKSDDLPF